MALRTIIFRGKRVGDGQWVEGGFHIWETRMPCVVGADRLKPEEIKTMITVNSFADWNMPRTMQAVEVDPATIGQYTGLKDKNGKRIFEGDIVKVVSINNDHCQRGSASILCVRYIMGNPCVCYPGFESGTPLYPLCIGCSIEILDNIHDNPELLEGGVNDG